ncbi:MAG TPA: porin, partial [Oxalicibacterium sp.]|nr:porin [Oxalicibacterium sp.]
IEDLGNGLKAEFVLENGISTDDGTGNSGFSRLSFVGLNGGFGKVRLGKQENQIKEMLGKIDTFGAAGMANAHDFIGGASAVTVGIPQRQGNMVTWQSANYGGFNGSLGYIFGEQNDDNGLDSGWGARLGYGNGPLNVQFAYQKQNHFTDTGVDGDAKSALLGATYDFGVVKLHGLYGQRKFDVGVVDPTESVKVNTGLIGVTVPFGASAVRAEYINNSDKDRDDADSDVFAVSYTYAMSKRTTLYATYVHVSNDDNSNLGLGADGDPAAANGESVKGFGVGINHKF